MTLGEGPGTFPGVGFVEWGPGDQSFVIGQMEGLGAPAPNNQCDAAKTLVVIQPSVPACTWDRPTCRRMPSAA